MQKTIVGLGVMLAALLPACAGNVQGGEPEEADCDPVEWRADEGAPLAAVGERLPFGGQVAAGRLGPFERASRVLELVVGQAPGWGCRTPRELAVAAWTGDESPTGDPAGLLEIRPVTGTVDLGGGFAAARVAELLDVDAGGFVFVGLSLDDNVCAAGTQGPADGAAWTWHPGEGWVVPDGRVVMGARGCELR